MTKHIAKVTLNKRNYNPLPSNMNMIDTQLLHDPSIFSIEYISKSLLLG